MAENLARMGNATVSLITLNGAPAIHKQNVTVVELSFYKDIAPALCDRGVRVPQVLQLNTATRDLFLEYIPYPVTQNELLADSAFIQMLSAVHTHPLTSPSSLYHHHWSDIACDITCEQINLSAAARSALQKIKSASDILFCSDSLVSGDSNAGNWGRTARKDIVLFDWERFGYGSAAIDLAPLIKGLGTPADYCTLAERYCRINRRYRVKDLCRAIAICKAWIATEVMMLLYLRQKSALTRYTAWYKKYLPDALAHISKAI